MDLCKIFDTLDHELLLILKLNTSGFGFLNVIIKVFIKSLAKN